jgi:hypothetical protein
MQTVQIALTLLYDGAKWVALFERQTDEGRSVCEVFCGTSEPLLVDVYTMLLASYRTLVFSHPVQDEGAAAVLPPTLNFKRRQRESRRLAENADALVNVRDATREERLLQKTLRAAEAKAEREVAAAYKYQRKQEQKKAKHRGH